MALGKDHLGYVQACAFNGNLMGDFPSLGTNGFGDSSSEKTNGVLTKNFARSQSSSSLGNPSSANSNEFVFQATSNKAEEAQPLISFNGGCNSLMQANGSLLSFQPKNRAPQSIHTDCYSNWLSEFNYNNPMNPKCSTDPRLLENLNCFRTACNSSSMSDPERECPGDWLYHEGTTLPESIQEPERHDTSFRKRPNTGERMQAPLKKQCNSTASATRKSKPKLSVPPKDPQSVAAKSRRERISERLKILQELVPNGSKVDLVTMLEKAISYVKFLQLQVKVLATDEFWPTQGGKAPDISQVKDAIDAILSSQRDRNSARAQSDWCVAAPHNKKQK